MNKKLSQILILAVAAIALVVTSVLGTMAFLTSSAAVANTFTVGNVYIHMYESAVNEDGTKKTDDPNVNGDMKDSAGNVYNLMPGNSYAKDPTIYVDAASEKSYLFLKVRNDIRSIEEGIVKFKSFDFETGKSNTPAYAIAEEEQTDGTIVKYNLEVVDGKIYVEDGKVHDVTNDKWIPLTMRAQMELKGWKYHHENANVIVYFYSYEPTRENLTNATQPDQYAQIVGGKNERQPVDVFDRFTIRGEVTDTAIYGAARVSLVAYAVQASGFGEPGTKSSVDEAWKAIVSLYPYESGDGFSG